MAKNPKSKTKIPNDLAPDKEEKITFLQVLRDERTHKIIGSIFLLIAALLFIAFTSYLFTWDEDQDKVFQEGRKMLWSTNTEVSNLMGTLGAYLSNFFIYKGFGIASYLLCTFFFVVGVNMFFQKRCWMYLETSDIL